MTRATREDITAVLISFFHTILRNHDGIFTHLDEFICEIFAGLRSVRKHISLLQKDPITAEELLIGPPAAFI